MWIRETRKIEEREARPPEKDLSPFYVIGLRAKKTQEKLEALINRSKRTVRRDGKIVPLPK
jgi:hypothetical protein